MKQFAIDKSKLNLIIDLIMFLLMMPIAGIGFLMKYVLVAGFERNVLYGNHVELEFWGQTRHQWGFIHLVLSIVLLALLILHIIFHWKMIVCIFQRMIPKKTTRMVFVGLISLMSTVFISFSLFIQPEIVEKKPMHRNRINHSNSTRHDSEKDLSPKQIDHVSIDNSPKTSLRKNSPHLSSNEEIEVYGSQTLQFVADKYNVPVDIIAADLKIPQERSQEKLGRIKKQYPFTMDDVRTSIINFKKRGK